MMVERIHIPFEKYGKKHVLLPMKYEGTHEKSDLSVLRMSGKMLVEATKSVKKEQEDPT